MVDQHGTAVQAVLRALELDHSVREELWSEVFEIAFRRIDELDDLQPHQRRQWLLRTARNLTANVARRAITRRKVMERLCQEPIEVALSAEDDYLDTVSLYSDKTQAALVKQAWDQLTEDHRQVLGMDALGHKGPAIAEQLEVSPEAARSRLMRARRAFVAAFEAVGTGSGSGDPDSGGALA